MLEIDITGITFQDSSYRKINENVIENLSVELQNLGCVSNISFLSYQPDFDLFEEKLQNLHERIKLGYKKIVPALFVPPKKLDFAKQYRRRLNIYMNLRAQYKQEREDRYKILKEIYLTGKHIKALSIFLEGTSEFLLVLEDDATPTPVLDRASLNSLIVFLNNHNNSTTYIDLCQHFTIESVAERYGLKKGISESIFTNYTFFANTTVAYVISRKAAELFLCEIEANPEFRLLGVDWLFTYIARSTEAKHNLIYYVAQESFFTNDSLNKCS